MDELRELIGASPAIVCAAHEHQAARADQRGRDAAARRAHPGETGTGKGLVARLLHRVGPRAAGPFVDVNCAAIPETLLEAELFGYERGAFTDARQAKPGLFQTAHGGTLFLDEIGLLPEALQAKLLKVLEDRAVRRLGAHAERAGRRVDHQRDQRGSGGRDARRAASARTSTTASRCSRSPAAAARARQRHHAPRRALPRARVRRLRPAAAKTLAPERAAAAPRATRGRATSASSQRHGARGAHGGRRAAWTAESLELADASGRSTGASARRSSGEPRPRPARRRRAAPATR